MIQTNNPATGALLRTFPESTAKQIEEKLSTAHATFHIVRKNRNFREKRKQMLLRVADLLEKHESAHALLITREMGKTLKASNEEIKKCAVTIRNVVGLIDQWLEPETILLGDNRKAEIQYQPLGVILAVMPWNFPFWQVIRAAIPAALLGNSLLLKHASNVSGCSQALESLFQEAGAEPGFFQSLFLKGEAVLPIVDDPRIRAVTLTGSEPAGRQIAERAGRALKKVVLELGGSDPFIVSANADLNAAVKAAVTSRMLSNGQSCIAAKRFLIHASLYDSFREKLINEVSHIKMGSPEESAVGLGPLSSDRGKKEVEGLREDALENGASECFRGENKESAESSYCAISIIEGIPLAARLRKEEAFGPLFSLYPFQTNEEAVAIANETPFGLGASVWTINEDEKAFFSQEIDAGMIFLNSLVSSDGRIPFGGTKHSGFGRELGEAGIKEFSLLKTIVSG